MIEDSGSPAGTTIGIVGAGMMGRAIAYNCARAGVDVVLVARILDGARRGKSYGERCEATVTASFHRSGVPNPAINRSAHDIRSAQSLVQRRAVCRGGGARKGNLNGHLPV
ncbi:3-hydroxyacyl-CoA dehydrogenase NAD-binding domain-containing protein [Rhodococcus wratislaviensis]|uniref:3-hydroxyacyl-CoA dehydrogenase NAD-binding domain-containing protein n=1 Tax=Rhodococcus wratislaviensis TaxID=44752 RepID=UPI000F581920|nr:3-hydroxyacyl-CoA dehydrogenase NAD-binding domain-containing protein [Rhodococcus wratislaviensis]